VWRSVFTHGVRTRKWITENPCKDSIKPPAGARRDRRLLTKTEIEALAIATGYNKNTELLTKTARVGACFFLAMESALRSGEILRTGANRWSQSVAGAWWLRRGVFAPSDLPSLMGNSLANLGLQGFSPESCINDMCGKLSNDTLLSLSQIESTTYMRNQLLRDSDWASMHHSVELRTPLIDAWLLKDLQPLLGAFSQFPNKRLLAEAPLKPLTEAFINRPKTGFSIPVQKWLRESSHTSVAHANHGSWARAVAQRYDEDVM